MKLLPLYLTALFAVDAYAVRPKAPAETPAEPPAEKPADRAPGEKPPEYVLKNRSAFGMAKESRTPFWPIGWDISQVEKPIGPKTAPVVPVAKPFQIKDKGSAFVVTSLLLGNPPLATINGRAYGEGEYLPVVNAAGQPIKIVVKAIRDGGVTLEHEGEQLFVPMKREEPGPKQAGPKLQQVVPKIIIGG